MKELANSYSGKLTIVGNGTAFLGNANAFQNATVTIDTDDDQADFAPFVGCVTKPLSSLGPNCRRFDLDGDADSLDFAELQQECTGANRYRTNLMTRIERLRATETYDNTPKSTKDRCHPKPRYFVRESVPSRAFKESN